MNEQEYLQTRMDDQIVWYNDKSAMAQKMYKRLQIFQLAGASSIPFLAGYSSTYTSIQVVLGVLGVLLALTGGLLGLYQFQDRWLQYRTTCEALKHEKYMFLTRTAPYDGANPLQLLVQRVEGLISSENSGWVQVARSAKAASSQATGEK